MGWLVGRTCVLGRREGGWQAGWAGWLARAEQAEPARPSSSLFLFLFSFSSSLIRIQIWFLNLDSKLVHHID